MSLLDKITFVIACAWFGLVVVAGLTHAQEHHGWLALIHGLIIGGIVVAWAAFSRDEDAR